MEKRLTVAFAESQAASSAWTHFTNVQRSEPLLAKLNSKVDEAVKPQTAPKEEATHATLPVLPEVQEEAQSQDFSHRRHLAQSLVSELNSQVLLSKAYQAETAYITLKSMQGVHVEPHPLENEAIELIGTEATQVCGDEMEIETIGIHSDSEKYAAEQLVQELLSQQLYSAACKAEARFVEVISHREVCLMDEEKEDVPAISSNEESVPIDLPPDMSSDLEPSPDISMVTEPPSDISMVTEPPLDISMVTPSDTSYIASSTRGIGTNTESNTTSTGTSTEPLPLQDVGTCTEPCPLREVGCNTVVNCLDVLRRAKEIEELHMLKADHLILVKQLNEEKSKRLVAEQLVKIVQSDLSELRQRNVTEVTTRMRLENELGDAQGELSYANKQREEKEARITELEESLTGTSLLVRKLEEQNSISLMNRGGIDYMVQAKLAEGRAREAEQKLEVAQAELLQAQTEVRVLLERVGEAVREKSESVSSKVHTQLLQLADERALSAEKRAQDLEREILSLKEQLSSRDPPTGPYGTSSYGSMFPPLTSTSSLLSQPSYGLSSLYPSTSLGATNSKPGFLSHDTPLYLQPSTLKSHDYLETARSRSHDLLGSGYTKSHDLYSPLPKVEPKSHDLYSTSPKVELKSHDHHGASHDYHGKSHDIKERKPDPASKELELPLVSTISETSHMTKGAGHMTTKEGSESSDWSSSDEEEASDPLLPSSHRTLISQWEWRAMNQDTPSQPTQTTPTKKKPPPIAPKPRHLISSSHQEPTFEPASSFNEPPRGPSLVSSRRVKGPRGRRLPVRFSKQIGVLG